LILIKALADENIIVKGNGAIFLGSPAFVIDFGCEEVV